MASFVQAELDAGVADALARRHESEASVFQNRALRFPAEADKLNALAEEAGVAAVAAAKRADEIRPGGIPDPEGTPAGLADRRGAFAEDVDMANQGGIGIFDSNTRKLGEGEGTPNSRLNPESTVSPVFTLTDPAEALPKTAGSQEEQEEADLARIRSNLGITEPVVAADAERQKRGPGRPKKHVENE